MKRLILDLETDGLLYDCTKVHCMSIRDADTDLEFLYIGNWAVLRAISDIIDQNDEVTFIGHNIAAYDNEVLKKVLKIDLYKHCKVIDTMIMSQVLCPTILFDDMSKYRSKIPPKLFGSHGLKAWGHRLGEHKGEYTGGFEEYTEEMGSYCQQDTVVTRVLYDHLQSLIGSRTWK